MSLWLLLAYFLVWLFLGLNARIPTGIGIGLIATSAVLLVQDWPSLANQVATYAYYFLVIGVALMNIQNKVKSEKNRVILIFKHLKRKRKKKVEKLSV